MHIHVYTPAHIHSRKHIRIVYDNGKSGFVRCDQNSLVLRFSERGWAPTEDAILTEGWHCQGPLHERGPGHALGNPPGHLVMDCLGTEWEGLELAPVAAGISPRLPVV